MPPPARPPSRDARGALAGASTVDTRGEYHEIIAGVESDDTPAHRHGVYGLGPRVPMYALSPWSRGGWVNSQVFDHTSVLRFIEQRFGVAEPNISPWRRAVCGDLTSLFDFSAKARRSRNNPAGNRRAEPRARPRCPAPPRPPRRTSRRPLPPAARPAALARLPMRCTRIRHSATTRRCAWTIPARPAPCCMSTTGCIWSADHGAIPSRPASAWTASGTRRRTTAAMTCGARPQRFPSPLRRTSRRRRAGRARHPGQLCDAPGARLRLTLTNRANAPSSSISRTPPMGNAQTRRVAARRHVAMRLGRRPPGRLVRLRRHADGRPPPPSCAAWPDAWKPANPRPRTPRHGPGTDTGLESPA